MKKKRENPLFNLLLNVVIPSVVMMKLSDESLPGPLLGFDRGPHLSPVLRPRGFRLEADMEFFLHPGPCECSPDGGHWSLGTLPGVDDCQGGPDSPSLWGGRLCLKPHPLSPGETLPGGNSLPGRNRQGLFCQWTPGPLLGKNSSPFPTCCPLAFSSPPS